MAKPDAEQEAKKFDYAEIVSDLVWVAEECESRCMFDSSKWTYEILSNFSPVYYDAYEKSQRTKATTSKLHQETSHSTADKFVIKHAKELIRDKEFHRAKFLLEKFNLRGNQETFLYYWSWYMISMQNRQESEAEGLNRKQEFHDTELSELRHELEKVKREKPDKFDCFLNSLLGMVRTDNQTKSDARDAFMEAIKQDHRCWPAWSGLAANVEDKCDIDEMDLPIEKWQYILFMAESMYHLQLLRGCIDCYNMVLESILGHVPYVICQVAAAKSSLQEHGDAIEAFEKVRKLDPYRIEHMNMYSNSLFIRDCSVQLASLAHHFFETHKFTWQTCCILGNYYSNRKEHPKAQEFLLRATKLSPYDSSIWVLLGHEFMETKNNSAAILAYRKATVLDPHCYRGWYGLGQLYEILKAHAYSLYYYEQAHRRRPDDSRILVALGVCFVKLNRKSDAEKCFKKAFQIGDLQANALTHLGKLYEEQNENAKAAKVYETYLKIYCEDMVHDINAYALCCRFLTKHYLEVGDLETSYAFAQRCLGYEKTKEEAYYYIRQINRKRDELRQVEEVGILADQSINSYNDSTLPSGTTLGGRMSVMSDIVTPGEPRTAASAGPSTEATGDRGTGINQTNDEERTSQQIEDMAISDDDNLEISF